MEQIPTPFAGARRNEDIALDMMKFIAVTTGYGRTGSCQRRLPGWRSIASR